MYVFVHHKLIPYIIAIWLQTPMPYNKHKLVGKVNFDYEELLRSLRDFS